MNYPECSECGGDLVEPKEINDGICIDCQVAQQLWNTETTKTIANGGTNRIPAL